jgi:hypothetical protein
MPALRKKFYYYKDYAVAGFNDIFTPAQQNGMLELKASELKNCWLENKGGQLILHELPVAAQFSAIQGAVATDVNNDGAKEIFAAGNFYPFRVQLGREDAGKGVLLEWNAKKHAVIHSDLRLGICANGDVRDLVSIRTVKGEQLILISKNGDPVQVIRRREGWRQK